MLPDFPLIKSDRYNRLFKRAYSTSQQKHPVLTAAAEGVIAQPEGAEVALTDVDGNVAMKGYETFQSMMEVRADELPLLDDNAWLKKLGAMTDQFADDQEKLLFKRLDEATTATGNVIRTGGKPISEAHILEMLDRLPLDFEGQQISRDISFVIHPSMADHFAQVTESESFKSQHDRIIERQYIDWRFREADRKLAD